MNIVPPSGPKSATVLAVGEAPGEMEWKFGYPFAGPTGLEQSMLCNKHGYSTSSWRFTNICLEYTPSNPDPTPQQISYWSSTLLDEVYSLPNLEIIIALGGYAVKWFLGERASLESVYGIPHQAGCFDSTRTAHANNAIILPLFHPAAGFRSSSMRAKIWNGYGLLGEVIKEVMSSRINGVTFKYPLDEYPNVSYNECKGYELAKDGVLCEILNEIDAISLDTEDGPDNYPWSIQLSWQPGSAIILYTSDETIDTAIETLQRLADRGVTFVGHSWIHDLSRCRQLGLDLSQATLYDTRYGQYIQGLYRQGLKLCAWRYCHMAMQKYTEVVGPVTKELQINYLINLVEYPGGWPDVLPYYSEENNGTLKYNSRFWQIDKKARRLLGDLVDDKRDSKGKPIDVGDRWFKKTDPKIRIACEKVLGLMPLMATLDNVDPNEAMKYACADPDATFRVYLKQRPILESKGLIPLMVEGMATLPIFEEMQSNGLPASRKRFQLLYAKMSRYMKIVQIRISHKYCDGKPFNPGSSIQTAEVMKRLGLEGTKETKGKIEVDKNGVETRVPGISTAKTSIEYLRDQRPVDEKDFLRCPTQHPDGVLESTHPFITDLFTWRDCEITRDNVCTVYLNLFDPNGPDIQYVKADLLPYSTVTRRLSSKNPNILGLPKHKLQGGWTRNCFICEEDRVFAEWDLSQIEVAGIAHESQDNLLCDLINEGLDVHTRTAMSIFQLPADKIVKSTMRLPAKTAFFQMLYGGGPSALSNQLTQEGLKGWDEPKCKELKDKLIGTYSKVQEYIEEVGRELQYNGIVYDASGMPRYLPGIWSAKSGIASEALRHAISHKVQGWAQTALQRSMAWLRPVVKKLQDNGLDIRWGLQYHDSLILIIDKDLWSMVDVVITEGLTKHHEIEGLRFPIRCEGSCNRSWGGLE